MPFQVSPGVNVSEIDLTTVVPAVSTTEGAIAGVFRWGPVDQRVLIDSENSLVNRFGKPYRNMGEETWFTAANFLSYGNKLYVVRVANTTSTNDAIGTLTAFANVGTVASPESQVVKNDVDYEDKDGTFDTDVLYVARYPGSIGNSLKISVCDSSNAYNSTIQLSNTENDYSGTFTANSSGLSVTIAANSVAFNTNTGIDANGFFSIATNPIANGTYVKYITAAGNTAPTGLTNNSLYLVISSNTSGIQLGNTSYFANAVSFNANSDVNNTDETIAIASASTKYAVGDKVQYIVAAGNTAISGLSNGSYYWIATANSTTVTLAATYGGANVNITKGATESGHSLTAVERLVVPTAKASSESHTFVAWSLAQTAILSLSSSITTGDLIKVGNSTVGEQYMKVSAVGTNVTATNTSLTIDISTEDNYRLKSAYTSNTIDRYWEFYNVVDRAPGQSEYVASFGNTSANDEVHVVIVDEDGKFTETPGQILEVYKNLSRADDAKTADGAARYYKTVINEQSKYIWWANDRSGAATAQAASIASSTNETPLSLSFEGATGGYNELNAPLSLIAGGYDLFASAEDVDVSLILQGKAKSNATLANYIIDNICEVRKDCVAFVSPLKNDVVNNIGGELDSVLAFKNSVRSSSYAVVDSGYKYQYDKYNDVYRWVPLNGDIAGLCVRTDNTNDPWWSPAGFNRGNIKNIVKLAYNPGKADRDQLYKAGVNPVVAFPGQGIVLFGDKTALNKPSAFDRINVRRLFIVLEKAIATAAKFTLFEFNDEFTRAQFRNLVIPYLRDIKGRRGITDFLVVCDQTNNTAEVIDRNEFVGDIYIKPARSINFIQLNFVAVRTGVAFSEIVGKF
jgi:phage tail sheath protein FI